MNKENEYLLVPAKDLQDGIEQMKKFIESHSGYECLTSNSRKAVYEDFLGIYPRVWLDEAALSNLIK